MRVFTARVTRGRLGLPEGELPEGATVTVLIHEDDEAGFRLPQAEQEELLEAMAACERGEYVDGWELLRELER